MDEPLRQLGHAVLGLAFAGVVYLAGTFLALEISLAVLLLGVILSLLFAFFRRPHFLHGWLKRVQRGSEAFPGQPILLYVLAITVTLAFFVLQPSQVAFGALLCLALGDSVSTLAGKKWGVHKLLPNRSVEGSFAGFAISAIALYIFFPLHVALIAAALGMAAEYLPLDDNFGVPLFSGLALMLLL